MIRKNFNYGVDGVNVSILIERKNYKSEVHYLKIDKKIFESGAVYHVSIQVGSVPLKDTPALAHAFFNINCVLNEDVFQCSWEHQKKGSYILELLREDFLKELYFHLQKMNASLGEQFEKNNIIQSIIKSYR